MSGRPFSGGVHSRTRKSLKVLKTHLMCTTLVSRKGAIGRCGQGPDYDELYIPC